MRIILTSQVVAKRVASIAALAQCCTVSLRNYTLSNYSPVTTSAVGLKEL